MVHEEQVRAALDLYVEARPNKVIAKALGIDERTVLDLLAEGLAPSLQAQFWRVTEARAVECLRLERQYERAYELTDPSYPVGVRLQALARCEKITALRMKLLGLERIPPPAAPPDDGLNDAVDFDDGELVPQVADA